MPLPNATRHEALLMNAMPLTKSLAYCPDPLAAFIQLTGGGLRPDTLFFESADNTTRHGEKSLLVVRSALRIQCRARRVHVTALNANGRNLLPWLAESLRERALVIPSPAGLTVDFAPPADGNDEARLRAASPVDVLRALVNVPGAPSGPAPSGPLVAGMFAYDFLGAYESLPPPATDPWQWPDYEFTLPDEMVWINHKQRNAVAVAWVFGGGPATPEYYDAAEAITRITSGYESISTDIARPVIERQGTSPLHAVQVDLDDPTFAATVEALKRHIRAGDVIQIVPSRTFSLPCTDPIGVYRRLREVNPSPYMFFINATSGILLGASPETAIRVEGEPKRVMIRPIAGTRPRARRSDGTIDEDLDGRLEVDLRLNEKEIAEHMMLVDLARNDVARVSKSGSRRLDALLTVERYSHVMHLVSSVSGELRDGFDALSAYVASMNMGTLVGAPKLKAAELLRRYEPTSRGPYGGAVGYFTRDGRMDTCIVIRSAVVRDGVAHVRAGAGVVHDSDPAAEALETRHKAEAVLQVVREIERGAA